MASAFVHCSQLTDENHSNPAFRVCPSSAAEAHFRPLLRLSESEGERRPRPRFRLLERQREDPGLERPRAPIRHHRVEELRQLHRNLSVEADAQGTAAAVRHAHAPVDGCRCEATLPAPLGGRSPRPRAWRRRARTALRVRTPRPPPPSGSTRSCRCRRAQSGRRRRVPPPPHRSPSAPRLPTPSPATTLRDQSRRWPRLEYSQTAASEPGAVRGDPVDASPSPPPPPSRRTHRDTYTSPWIASPLSPAARASASALSLRGRERSAPT